MGSQNGHNKSLQDLLERIRNGEISSDEALALYKQPGADEETAQSHDDSELVYCCSDWQPSPHVEQSARPASGPCLVFGTDKSASSSLANLEAVTSVILVK